MPTANARVKHHLQAFLHSVVQPAIAQREAAGEFRAFCTELDRWDSTAPVAASQMRAVLSRDAVATRAPSGEKAQQ